MSAKTPPTDQSKDCNELSIQNGRATYPISVSGQVTSSSNEAPKKTSRTGRVLKPSAKQKAANNASASRVDRIAGKDSLAAKTARCDFSSSDSINEIFPCHKGKGTQDIPPELLSLKKTPSAKAIAVQDWRMLTNKQQLERIVRIVESQQREEQAATRALAEIDMGGGRGKRKRTSTEKAQQQQQQQQQQKKSTEVVPPPKKKKKKRAPNKEKTQAQKDKSAQSKRDRDDRRNEVRRKKAAEERNSRLQKDVSNVVVVRSLPMLFSAIISP